jgi:OHCU decarboxylase
MGAWPGSGSLAGRCDRVSLRELDTGAADRAAEALDSCCGSERWVAAMLARRPFGSRERLRQAAVEVWRALTPEDWKAAFARHPRIGEEAQASTQSGLGRRWSAGEQARVSRAGDPVRDALARVNRDYEARFGYRYIVCAEGRPAEELLEDARRRLGHSPAVEIGIAAEEQLRITLLRLDKLTRGA